MQPIKNLFIDVETTGLNPHQNAVHQISGMVVIDGEVKEQFDFNVKPHPGSVINPATMEFLGMTEAELMTFPSHETVYKELIDILSKNVDRYDKSDKYFFTAYNAHFDNGFIRSFFGANNDKYFGSWFWSSSIDVMVLAAEALKNVRHEMENFKLMTVAKQLGIQVDESKLHKSDYDIDITFQIYNLLTNKK